MLPWDMVELQTPESPFQLADFLIVRVHERALAVGALHDLVDYQLGVAIDVQAGCPDVDGYTETTDECLILYNVVGCREMEANYVLELASFWGDQDDLGPRAGSHDRPVEVEGPLGDKVSQGLRLYRRTWHELDVVAHQLDCPFGDPPHCVAVVNNFSEWE